LELRNPLDPMEPHSSMWITSLGLQIDFVGPLGFEDHRLETVVQPGQPGYRRPPAGSVAA
jgi:hypothetical protein